MQATSQPTRTIPLGDLRRRAMPHERPQRQILPRDRHAAVLRPRVPDVTVTATVVDVNVKEGTATLASTEITAATTNTVVSVSDLGSVTIPPVSTFSTTNVTTNGTITSTPSTTTSSTSFYTSTSVSTNGTTNSTTESTVTVTETSTFEITFSNGTFIPPSTSHTSRNHTATSHHTSNGTLVLTSSTLSSPSSVLSSTLTSTISETGSSVSSIILFPGGSITSTGTSLPTSSPSTTTTTTATSPPSGPGLTPTQQGVVGGVVGGLSGLALVLLGVLMFLRWYRTRLQSRRDAPKGGIFPSRLRDNNGSRRHIRGTSSNGGGSGGGYGYELTQSQSHHRSSSTAVVAAAFANSLRRFTRPHSTTSSTDFSTNATTAGSERGFQKIAGRKLGPVLSTGEDPYGGNYGVFEKEFHAVPAGPHVGTPTTDQQQEQQNLERNLSRNSFYRGDSRGFYASANCLPGQQTRSSSQPALAASHASPRSPQFQTHGTRGFTDNFPMPPANSPAVPLVSSAVPTSPRANSAHTNHANMNNTPYSLRTPPNSSPPRPRPFSPRSQSATHLPHTASPLRPVPGPTALTRPEGFAVMRPSPARTPTTSSLPDAGAMLGSPTHRSKTNETFPFPSPPLRAIPIGGTSSATDAGMGMGMVEILLDSADDVPPTPPLPERHGLHHYSDGNGNGALGGDKSSPRGRSAVMGAGQGQGHFLDTRGIGRVVGSGVRAGSSRSQSRFKEVV